MSAVTYLKSMSEALEKLPSALARPKQSDLLPPTSDLERKQEDDRFAVDSTDLISSPNYQDLAGAHVVVGLSGGVDSSLSAALLKEANLKVTALFMKNWEEDDTNEYCSAAQDRADAEKVCETLGIELKTINFAAEYWDRVFENFLSEYKAGRTPNPDILCNKEIKFKAFLDYALEDLNADFIATGHYCRRNFVHDNSPINLLRGLDKNKDQSYFLHAIGPHKLERVLFPVGHIDKPLVREMAQERGLITARKKDSTGICFIGEKRFGQFLHQYLPDASTPGPIINLDTNQVMGEHPGLMYCTIGQRKGLNIGGTKNGSGEGWYVVDKDLANNALIVVQGHNHNAIYAGGLVASQDTWITKRPTQAFRCTCKVRYRQPDVKCTVVLNEDMHASPSLAVYFDEKVASVAPGQSVVFYQGAVCLGGAVIEAALPPQQFLNVLGGFYHPLPC